MKWQKNKSNSPRKGDKREVRRFAWFPVELTSGYMIWWEYYVAIEVWTNEPWPDNYIYGNCRWMTTNIYQELK